jgi:hypothetical protein
MAHILSYKNNHGFIKDGHVKGNVVYFICKGQKPTYRITPGNIICEKASSYYFIPIKDIICEKAFFNDATIERVYVNSAITAIGRSAFEGCSVLVQFGCNQNKNDVILEKDSFKDCTELQTVILPCNKITIKEDAFSGCCKLRTVVLQGNQSNPVKPDIADSAFSDCKGLTLVAPRDMISDFAQRNQIHFVEYDY